MGRQGTVFLVAVFLLTAAACVPRGFVKDPKPWTEGTDWSQASRLEVTLTESTFSPQILNLREGVAYAVEFQNRSRERYRLTSGEFFRAVAPFRISAPTDGAAAVERLSSLEIAPNQSMAFQFVAVRPGTYDLVASSGAVRRMTGAVSIAPR